MGIIPANLYSFGGINPNILNKIGLRESEWHECPRSSQERLKTIQIPVFQPRSPLIYGFTG